MKTPLNSLWILLLVASYPLNGFSQPEPSQPNDLHPGSPQRSFDQFDAKSILKDPEVQERFLKKLNGEIAQRGNFSFRKAETLSPMLVELLKQNKKSDAIIEVIDLLHEFRPGIPFESLYLHIKEYTPKTALKAREVLQKKSSEVTVEQVQNILNYYSKNQAEKNVVLREYLDSMHRFFQTTSSNGTKTNFLSMMSPLARDASSKEVFMEYWPKLSQETFNGNNIIRNELEDFITTYQDGPKSLPVKKKIADTPPSISKWISGDQWRGHELLEKARSSLQPELIDYWLKTYQTPFAVNTQTIKRMQEIADQTYHKKFNGTLTAIFEQPQSPQASTDLKILKHLLQEPEKNNVDLVTAIVKFHARTPSTPASEKNFLQLKKVIAENIQKNEVTWMGKFKTIENLETKKMIAESIMQDNPKIQNRVGLDEFQKQLKSEKDAYLQHLADQMESRQLKRTSLSQWNCLRKTILDQLATGYRAPLAP